MNNHIMNLITIAVIFLTFGYLLGVYEESKRLRPNSRPVKPKYLKEYFNDAFLGWLSDNGWVLIHERKNSDFHIAIWQFKTETGFAYKYGKLHIESFHESNDSVVTLYRSPEFGVGKEKFALRNIVAVLRRRGYYHRRQNL